MKKRTILFVTLVLIGFLSFIIVYWRLYHVLPAQFVRTFIELSYNADKDTIEQVVKEQESFYEDTYKSYICQNPQIDVDHFINTGQKMETISDIQLEVKKNQNGIIVVEAQFQVKFTDNLYPNGFVMDISLQFNLIKGNDNEYKISYIG